MFVSVYWQYLAEASITDLHFIPCNHFPLKWLQIITFSTICIRLLLPLFEMHLDKAECACQHTYYYCYLQTNKIFLSNTDVPTPVCRKIKQSGQKLMFLSHIFPPFHSQGHVIPVEWVSLKWICRTSLIIVLQSEFKSPGTSTITFLFARKIYIRYYVIKYINTDINIK